MSSFFTFRGEIGRLRFLLSCLTLGGGLVLTFVLLLVLSAGSTGGRSGGMAALVMPLLIVLPLGLWASFSLQTCRIRDIGWNPVFIVPTVFLLNLADIMLVKSHPTLAAGYANNHGLLHAFHQNTVIGALMNLVFDGVMLFWPGGSFAPPEIDSFGLDQPPAPAPSAATVTAPLRPRLAANASGTSGFGRRGL